MGAVVWAISTRGADPDRNTSIGLFTSLPILWSEEQSVSAMLSSTAPPHWARNVLERRGTLLALDTLLDLSRTRRLVIAQPRPLMPEENVALDNWVRGGGKLLLFADPMLTRESAFPLGDRRRPQDIALISPILRRWGLQLRFDDSQPAASRENTGEGLSVALPGVLEAFPGGVEARCQIGPEGLVARCKIAKGQALIVADAALLEADAAPAGKRTQFEALLDQAFPR
ncbi:hypothetical protein GGQ88_002646 [Novosphingobium hassiacum]|uniref:ABC transporter n=1 Tax=Novosphingobium hassiacum TaxID=173676 RepID=A0A7W6EWH3_9SPHN|nr:GldG family protein [Novosphingobium hassiacum]MBB3861362.1 hypothetical protein [Novosphingobium hassiacum]